MRVQASTRSTKLRAAGFDTRVIAKALFGAYERQIFVDGFHHGDPEPANLLVDLNGNVVFLDFGLMGVLRPERRDNFTRMIFAVFDDDVEEVVKLISEVSAPDSAEAARPLQGRDVQGAHIEQ